MGMAVSIDLRDATADQAAVDAVVAWFHHVDDTFSTYKAASPISAFGRGELGFDDLTEEIRGVLRRLRGTPCRHRRVLRRIRPPAPNGTMFDPSGFVKGWSIEHAAHVLEARDIHNFCINAGGDIVLRGAPGPNESWRVGIRHPDDRDALATVVTGEGPLAIATSALYERGAHIIDPRTGQPSIELASVTIVGPDLGTADGYATVAFVMGLDGLETRPGYDAYIITRDDTTHWTPGFARFRSDHTT